ncbi:MAG: helix-turn-helix domain-containing protein, partial [Armatimonadota bacterium]|nr:helix-turn-helix domain-containing protein [Armatimonadota bacterium]
MSKEENRRAMILVGAKERNRTNDEIAQALGLGVRQVQRLKQALNEHGPVGLAHGNRGRKASHAVADKIVEEVERLYKTTYKGFN